jgi:hypothetical protein
MKKQGRTALRDLTTKATLPSRHSPLKMMAVADHRSVLAWGGTDSGMAGGHGIRDWGQQWIRHLHADGGGSSGRLGRESIGCRSRCWSLRDLAKAEPADLIAFLQLDPHLIGSGSRLDLADAEALGVVLADVGLRDVQRGAVDEDGGELTVVLEGAGQR